jgi:hypothetical protein
VCSMRVYFLCSCVCSSARDFLHVYVYVNVYVYARYTLRRVFVCACVLALMYNACIYKHYTHTFSCSACTLLHTHAMHSTHRKTAGLTLKFAALDFLDLHPLGKDLLTRICAHIYIYMYSHIHIYIYTCMIIYIYIFIHSRHTQIIQVHTYIHMYAYDLLHRKFGRSTLAPRKIFHFLL